MYTSFRYDGKNRIIKTIRHHNYNSESSFSITNYTYFNDSLSATYKTIYDGKIGLTGKKVYNKNWKELSDESYNVNLNSSAFDEFFTYDDNNRLVTYQVINGDGSATECPEINGYVDNYKYNEDGFLISVQHIFEENTCEMTFEYRN